MTSLLPCRRVCAVLGSRQRPIRQAAHSAGQHSHAAGVHRGLLLCTHDWTVDTVQGPAGSGRCACACCTVCFYEVTLLAGSVGCYLVQTISLLLLSRGLQEAAGALGCTALSVQTTGGIYWLLPSLDHADGPANTVPASCRVQQACT
jgi:hypothetical protein